jgi:hypothetical protein
LFDDSRFRLCLDACFTLLDAVGVIEAFDSFDTLGVFGARDRLERRRLAS